jgi:pyruvate formate lyase activating enzyme
MGFEFGKSGTFERHPERDFTKREFLKLCGAGLCAIGASAFFALPKNAKAQMATKGLIKKKLSPYFAPLSGGKIRCELCPRRCTIREGKRGDCRVRENRGGKCYSLVYGNPCIIHLDPIEKEGFCHVLPGTNTLTLSTAGCNFRCKSCENWEISQAFPEDVYSYDVPPETIVKRAKGMGARSITYTYAEPTVFFEYMLDTASLAKKAGLTNAIHSNGFINREPLKRLCNVLDAAQIDLKGFATSFYRELSGGELAPVLETLKTLKQEKIHLEITNLMIPTKNEEMVMVRDMCQWIRYELGPRTPVHFTRFYPLYKLQRLPSTPVSLLDKARAVALSSGLEHVYIGKVPRHKAWNTFCPTCGKMIIHRTGYMISGIHMEGSTCGYCGRPIPGIWA